MRNTSQEASRCWQVRDLGAQGSGPRWRPLPALEGLSSRTSVSPCSALISLQHTAGCPGAGGGIALCTEGSYEIGMGERGPGVPLSGGNPSLAVPSRISPGPAWTLSGLIPSVASLLPGTPPARQMGKQRLCVPLGDLSGSETAGLPEPSLHLSTRTPGRTRGHLQKWEDRMGQHSLGHTFLEEP